MTIWNGVPQGFDRDGKPIAYNKSADGSGNAPSLVFGPPGSRKTVGLMATQLLDGPSWLAMLFGRYGPPRSYVVVDPKAELAAISANYRRKVCGEENVHPINA